MSYVKTNWQNDQAPAINATNLNKIEQGIYDNDGNISSINGTLGVDTNTWVGTTAYGEGDIVIYNDKIYQNISGTSTTTNPADDTTNWDEITIFDTDSINDDLIDKTKFIKNTHTNSAVKSYSCDYVNGANTYSTTEANTHQKWIDGKDIYRKVIYISSLPNDDTLNTAHNITNIERVVSLRGNAYNSSGVIFPLPYYNPRATTLGISLQNDTTNILITTGSDRTGLQAYIIMEYTKTN